MGMGVGDVGGCRRKVLKRGGWTPWGPFGGEKRLGGEEGGGGEVKKKGKEQKKGRHAKEIKVSVEKGPLRCL